MRNVSFAIFIALIAGPLAAQAANEKPLPLNGLIADDGRSVELSWFEAKPPRVGSVSVNRRRLGESGAESWRPLATGLGPVLRFTDDSIQPGTAYEYQVFRSARDIVDVGYWAAGVELPAQEPQGRAYVIVDESLASDLAPRLNRFENDLTGDGWTVFRHNAPRRSGTDPVTNLKEALPIKNWLQSRYAEDPFGTHAVILIGDLPVVHSGRSNPDGHKPVPHPTDLFYADMDGKWSISSQGLLLDNRVPGNFIEMQVGRINLANLSKNDYETELGLLRAYFDKNHHWRQGLHGDLRNAYGRGKHLTTETLALANIVGPDAVTQGGHHDVGEERPWLWGIGFGDWGGYKYAERYANKAVFAINFGSGKLRFDAPFSALTAHLAQPWYTVAVGWGARPAWWLHHMALGRSIGVSHMRTVNNGQAKRPYRETMDYFPTGNYLWRNPIWVNLLGDPTLRPFMLAPVTSLRAELKDQTVALSWTASPDPDVTGYKLYRSSPDSNTFSALSGGEFVRGLSFTDTAPEADARYMVRAYGLKRVHAGSFYTFSQGRFAGIGETPLVAEDMTITAAAGQIVPLSGSFGGADENRIRAFIEAADVGNLELDGTAWNYRPPEGFTGPVSFRFSMSDGQQTDEGALTIVFSN